MGFWKHLFGNHDHLINQQCSLATKINLLQSQSDRILSQLRDVEKAFAKLEKTTLAVTNPYSCKINDPQITTTETPPKVRSQYFRKQAEYATSTPVPERPYTPSDTIIAGMAGVALGLAASSLYESSTTEEYKGGGGRFDGGGSSDSYSVDTSASSCDSGSSSCDSGSSSTND